MSRLTPCHPATPSSLPRLALGSGVGFFNLLIIAIVLVIRYHPSSKVHIDKIKKVKSFHRFTTRSGRLGLGPLCDILLPFPVIEDKKNSITNIHGTHVLTPSGNSTL